MGPIVEGGPQALSRSPACGLSPQRARDRRGPPLPSRGGLPIPTSDPWTVRFTAAHPGAPPAVGGFGGALAFGAAQAPAAGPALAGGFGGAVQAQPPGFGGGAAPGPAPGQSAGGFGAPLWAGAGAGGPQAGGGFGAAAGGGFGAPAAAPVASLFGVPAQTGQAAPPAFGAGPFGGAAGPGPGRLPPAPSQAQGDGRAAASQAHELVTALPRGP
jgi:hypothetical protein